MRIWMKVVLIVVGVLVILMCCAGVASATYWFGITRVVVEKPVAQATEEPAVVANSTSIVIVVTATPVTVQPMAVMSTAQPAANTPTPQAPSGTSDVQEVFRAGDSLAYPALIPPDASRQPVFPDVPFGSRPALVAYESPFEDGDFCDNTPCGVDIPQYYYRVMTAGQVTIPDVGVNCVATETKGCAVIIVNHFGPTAMYRGNTIDHGFTIAGRVWDMSKPELVTLASQALLDHYMLRMTGVEDGANCGTIDACQSVEWHVVIVGNSEVQVHWTGIFRR